MEEQIGLWWHKGISAWAAPGYRRQRTALATQQRPLEIIFRAFGGSPGLQLEVAAHNRHWGYRSWLQRLSGQHQRVALAWITQEVWCLPETLEVFPSKALNDRLYLWLTAMASVYPHTSGSWAQRNQQATVHLLRHYPGLANPYFALVTAELQRRPALKNLPAAQHAPEQMIRHLLQFPDSTPATLDPPAMTIEPVWLWLNQYHSAAGHSLPPEDADLNPPHSTSQKQRESQKDATRRQAETVKEPQRRDGLLLFRPESIFSWTEFTQVNHEQQENDEEDLARAANDLDRLSLSRSTDAPVRVLALNLEQAPRSTESPPRPEGPIAIDEWDYQRQRLRKNQCAVHLQTPSAWPAIAETAPKHSPESRRLQRLLAQLQPEQRRTQHQTQGDLEIQRYLDRLGQDLDEPDCFSQLRKHQRDFCCLLLADVSLSTESSILQDTRVIDVIGASLGVFAQALGALRDRWALYTFSSNRQDLQITELKAFTTPVHPAFHAQVRQLQPCGYTRMGPAIRYLSQQLQQEKSRDRLLLVLSDGKPNDADYYEGRYGLEDTRHAVLAARKSGLKVFCITIDQEAPHYLPHVFGQHGFTVIRHVQELPHYLPVLYAQLTGR